MSSYCRLIRPSPVFLSDFTKARRVPPETGVSKDEDQSSDFDGDTLFYDLFRDADSNVVRAGGPALTNLTQEVAAFRVHALPSGDICSFKVQAVDRHMRYVIQVPKNTTGLAFEGPLGRFVALIQENLQYVFNGRRLLLTRTDNRRPDWIADWIRHHCDQHGADAVLLYDNGLTDASSDELMDVVRDLPGVRTLVVVEWPFKMHPHGADERRWDAHSCDHGLLEHARLRFAKKAAGVMKGAVDEWLMSSTNAGIFDALAHSRTGYLRYSGRKLADGEALTVGAPPYPLWKKMLRSNRDLCPPQWTLAPQDCPENAQWRPHDVANWLLFQPRLHPQFQFRQIGIQGRDAIYENQGKKNAQVQDDHAIPGGMDYQVAFAGADSSKNGV